MSSIIKSSDVIFNDKRKNASGVINSLNINTLGSNPVISDINREKDIIIEKAIKDAKEIVEDAKASMMILQRDSINECNTIKQKAYDDGFESGKSEGRKAGEAEAYEETKARLENEEEKTLAELLKMIYLVEDGKDAIIKKYENSIIHVAAEIAKKIVKTELKINKDIIKNMLNDSLSNYKKCEWIKIYVAEDDYITVSTDSDIADRLKKISEHVKIERLSGKSSGELVIETPDSIVNLGTDDQLKNLEDIILGAQEN